MKKIRLFIVDDDREYIDQARRYLQASGEIEVVDAVSDGFDAARRILQAQPDCLLTGLVLRRVNGFSLLRAIHPGLKRCVVIVCGEFASPTAIEMSVRAGADMFLSKPVPLPHLQECVVSAVRMKRRLEAEKERAQAVAPAIPANAEVYRALLNRGISPRMQGFSCLAEGLHRLLDNRQLLRNLRRNLYPGIAETLHCSPESVERSIRLAIRRAVAGTDAQPDTNRRFLTRVLEEILENRP